ncbi:Gfo/Idh/MocA family protein [Virgibacillus kekensis]|uniref:Gfo/Idh/MocA family protein n=1 Tax=Virgibacillus kekensis TaxID=202261 RepID=A0ABV9DH14_9BACI
MKDVKVAIIGVGAIAEATHLKYLKQHPEVTIEAVVDISINHAENIARTHQISYFFTTMDELLDSIKVDAVLICTPNLTHISLAKKAAAKGIHVFIEKPIGTAEDEINDYLNLAEEKKVLTMVGMTHRFRTDATILKKYVEQETFGEIYYAKAKLFRRRGTPQGWFTNKELAGGGAMMDIGVHALDLAWWLMGTPDVETITGKTLAALGTYQTKHVSTWESRNKYINANKVFDVEDFGAAWIRFSNGSVLSLEIAWAMNGKQDEGIQIELLGDKGGASLVPLTVYKEEIDGNFVTSSPHFVENDPFKDEIEHFIECIQTRTTPLISGEDGREVVKMLQGIYESSDKKREIQF